MPMYRQDEIGPAPRAKTGSWHGFTGGRGPVDENQAIQNIAGAYDKASSRVMGPDPGYGGAMRSRAARMANERLDYGASPYAIDPRDQGVFAARGNIAGRDYRQGSRRMALGTEQAASDMALRRAAAQEMIRQQMVNTDLLALGEEKQDQAAMQQMAMQMLGTGAGFALGGPPGAVAGNAGARAAGGGIGGYGYGSNRIQQVTPAY